MKRVASPSLEIARLGRLRVARATTAALYLLAALAAGFGHQPTAAAAANAAAPQDPAARIALAEICYGAPQAEDRQTDAPEPPARAADALCAACLLSQTLLAPPPSDEAVALAAPTLARHLSPPPAAHGADDAAEGAPPPARGPPLS
ncbi:MAG: hypothetical protein NXI21_06935 [Alphaproteobacteria bacterium]|nr:hypothetical protein [Alphaproteobacteria bacterium]